MLTPTTLISLACILNSGQHPSQKIEVTEAEVAAMESIVSSGACLPENFEKLILDSKSQENDAPRASLPTFECY